jgi:hypothetical protein
MGATALALSLSGPPVLAYVLAACVTIAVTVTRPTQAVILPSLVRGVNELTAVNVVSGWIESLSLFVAPLATGALIALSGPAAVFAVMAALVACATLLVVPLHGPAPAAAQTESSVHQAVTIVREVAHDRAARLLVSLLAGQFVVIGALDVLFVVLAVRVLGLGGQGAGYLNAAFGAGGVLGILLTVRLVGRPRLGPPLTLAALVWAAAFLILGLGPTVLGAFVLLTLAGSARTLLDVATRTLLQRTVSSHMLARVFGLLETLDSTGLAVGSLLAPALVALLGARSAVAGLAVIFPALLLITARQLRDIDANADVPVVEVALLRSLPLFCALAAPTLEGLARGSRTIEIPAGACLIREGDFGDTYYAIVDGTLEVTQGAVSLRTVGRGEGVGEVALLAGVLRTATVTAKTAARLLVIDAEHFIEVVTEHPISARVGEELLRAHLPTAQPAGA